MEKKSREESFTDVIPEAEEALYCDPLDVGNETGEKRFCPKNKEKTKNREKKRENSTFFG